MLNIVLGLIFSFAIGYGGYRKNSLSLDGAVGATILGTLIFYFGGIYLAFIMVAFFISSSLLTKYKGHLKEEVEKIHEKGGRRTISQVAANGLLGLVFSGLFFITKNDIFVLAYITAFAASNSDTWASEVGVLSKTPPVYILTFKPIQKGMSGGISFLGTFIAFLGSLFISILGALGYGLVYKFDNTAVLILMIAGLCGFIGSLIDSIIGATLQAKYKCSICGEITEKKLHHKEPCELIGGFSWINNDAVNFLSSLLASVLAMMVYLII